MSSAMYSGMDWSVSQRGWYVSSFFAVSFFSVGWCADLYAGPSEPKVPGAEVGGYASRVVLVLPGV